MGRGDLGVTLTRGFSCRRGRRVEKSLLIITHVVGIVHWVGGAAERCGHERRRSGECTGHHELCNNPCSNHSYR